MKYFPLVLILAVVIGCKKEEINPGPKEISKKIEIDTDSLIQIASDYIIKRKFDSAKAVLEEADKAFLFSNKPPIITDAIYLTDSTKYENLLIRMSDKDFSDLLKGSNNIKFPYLRDSLVIKTLGQLLYEKRFQRQNIIKKRKVSEQREKLEALKEKTGLRSVFAEKLQNHFYDQGVNVKVSISGKYNENLKLKYALMNEVWAHHFQKGEMINEIESSGFKRVDLTDGYDYSVYWKFE